MTIKTIRPSEVTELLSKRKSYKDGAYYRWHTASRLLTVSTDCKREYRYRVTEIPCDGDGRAFHLTKLDAGTDPEETGYSLQVNDAGPGWDICPCKGHERHDHCKHLDSMRGILRNGWYISDAEMATEAPVSPEPTDAEITDMGDRWEAEHAQDAPPAVVEPEPLRPVGMTITRRQSDPVTVWCGRDGTACPVVVLMLDYGVPLLQIYDFSPFAGAKPGSHAGGVRGDLIQWGGSSHRNGTIPGRHEPAFLGVIVYGLHPCCLLDELLEDAPPVIAERLQAAILATNLPY